MVAILGALKTQLDDRLVTAFEKERNKGRKLGEANPSIRSPHHRLFETKIGERWGQFWEFNQAYSWICQRQHSLIYEISNEAFL